MKTILLPTDFSESALNAGHYAAALTKQLGVFRIILYHSYQTKPIATDVPLITSAELNLKERSLEALNTFAEELKPLLLEGVSTEILADERPLLYALKNIIEEEQVELVVIGATGKSNLEKVLVGSNTLSLAQAGLAPLLIVPLNARFQNIHHVVFASDLKQVTQTTPVKLIKSFIHHLDARLLVLNVTEEDKNHFDPDSILEQEALHDLWDSEKATFHYTTHADIAQGITEFAEENDAQIAIIIPRQRGFFDSIFHRSISKKLALHTHIPLLLLKEES